MGKAEMVCRVRERSRGCQHSCPIKILIVHLEEHQFGHDKSHDKIEMILI